MGKITGFREYKREDPEKRGVEERVKDYREIYCGLSEDKIKIQAARCMNCGTPFCNWGCPTENVIPDWNDFVYRNNWKRSECILCIRYE